MKLRGKPKVGQVKIVAISVPTDVLERAKMKAQLSGYRFSFSGYVSRLLENDVAWVKTQPSSP